MKEGRGEDQRDVGAGIINPKKGVHLTARPFWGGRHALGGLAGGGGEAGIALGSLICLTGKNSLNGETHAKVRKIESG